MRTPRNGIDRCHRNMKSRCYNKNSERYSHYGARGIVVCEEWKSIHGFREWALAHDWEEGLTIDRIDNDGNYCPENCRWITKEENHNEMMARNLSNKSGIFSQI